jgi:hypothetical protein
MSRNQIVAAEVRCSQSNEDDLRSALNWVLTNGIFKDLSFHGNTKWQPVQLVTLALLGMWSSKAALTDAFADAQRWSIQLLGKAALTTYQGLAGALTTWTPTLIPLLWDRLHNLMATVDGEHWRIGVWLALAVDGSRDDVPRTRARMKFGFAPRTLATARRPSIAKRNPKECGVSAIGGRPPIR